MISFFGPKTCQMFHWWHWLTYGQGFPNAVAMQTLATDIAAIATIVAAGYAIKAFRAQSAQLVLAREQSRFAIEPVLQVVASREGANLFRSVINNRGSGPALSLFCWSDTDPAMFGKMIRREQGHLADVVGDLESNNSRPLIHHHISDHRHVRTLLVFQCFDRSGRIHQHHSLLEANGTGIWVVVETDEQFAERQIRIRKANSLHELRMEQSLPG